MIPRKGSMSASPIPVSHGCTYSVTILSFPDEGHRRPLPNQTHCGHHMQAMRDALPQGPLQSSAL